MIARPIRNGRLASALRDVERNGHCRSLELASEFALAARKRREQSQRETQEFQRASINIEILVIQSRRRLVIAHGLSSARPPYPFA